jgi:hypothetical protein
LPPGKTKAETIEELKKVRLSLPLSIDARNEEVKAAEANDKDYQKNSEEVLGGKKPPNKPAFMELFAPNTPAEDQMKVKTPEDAEDHAALLELHTELKEIIKRHNIDTSEARTRSPKEHNHLITKFFAHMALGHFKEGAPKKSFKEGLEENLMQTEGDKHDAAAKCLQGIMTAAPANFCWKPTTKNHVIPTKCASGWHRWGAECFKTCRSGTYWVWGGTCWDRCASGYADHGATCYWSLFSWYFKGHYWASRRTNFDSISKCDTADQYKGGALCYKDCSTYGKIGSSMVNCGIGACSSTGAQCASTIFNMIFEIGMSIASIAAMVFTAGAAAPATAAASAVTKMGGKAAAKKIAKNAMQGMLRAAKDRFIAGVKDQIKDFGKSMAMNGLKTFCNAYAYQYYDKLTDKPAKFDFTTLDPTGIATSIDACGKANNGAGCAAAVMGVVGNFDPTGLVGVAAAFTHSTCEATKNCNKIGCVARL